jgi:hypothetical protein
LTDAARCQRSQRQIHTDSTGGPLHCNVVVAARDIGGSALAFLDLMHASAELLGDRKPLGAVVDVIDNLGAMPSGEAGRIQTNALRGTAEDQHPAARPLA